MKYFYIVIFSLFSCIPCFSQNFEISNFLNSSININNVHQNSYRIAFTGGKHKFVDICENSSAFNLDTILKIVATDTGQIINWSTLQSSNHGYLNIGYQMIALKDTLTPSGQYFIPSFGYVGFDTFSVTISDSFFIDTITVFLNIRTLPNPGAISGLNDVCLGSSITLTDSISGTNWALTNANAIISNQGIVYSVKAGRDTVSFTVANSWCVASAFYPINISVFPNLQPISGKDTFCIETRDTLTNSFWTAYGTGIWSKITNNIVLLPPYSNYVVLFGKTMGTDTISYVVDNACGSDSVKKPIFVYPNPVANTIIGPNIVCTDSIGLYSSSFQGNYATWTTENPKIAIIDSEGNLQPVSNGQTSIFYNVYGKCGTNSSFKVVQIMEKPNSLLTYGSKNVCLGSEIQLYNNVAGGFWKTTTYRTIVDADSGTVKGEILGTDTIIYTITNYCGYDSIWFPVQVNPVTKIPIIDRWVNLLYTDSTYASYRWTKNGDNIAGANKDSITVTEPGLYEVWVTNSYGCIAVSDFIDLTLNPCPVSDIAIYPNPTKEIIYIKWCADTKVKVLNLVGITMLETDYAKKIDVSLLDKGCYILSFYNESGVFLTSKLITKI